MGRNSITSNQSLAILRNGAQSESLTYIIDYKGYRLEIGPVGKGWRASIYSRGSVRPLLDSPTNLEKSRKEDIIAQAKQIVDTHLRPRLV